MPFILHRVDFFIPGEPTVGGFTICSSPRKLDQEGTIDLAVKRSDHAPANWIHVQVYEHTWLLALYIYKTGCSVGK